MNKKRVRALLDAMNWDYGRGDITRVLWSKSRVLCRCTSSTDMPRFSVRGDTLYFRGHKRVITQKRGG